MDIPKNNKFRDYFAPGVIILSVLFTFIWRFSLIGKKTVFFADSTIAALPLANLRSLVLHGDLSPLWASGVYGGHPMLAEGQVAYFHPLAMAVAGLASSPAGVVYGLNLYLFLGSIIGGIGILGLCRTLGLNRWSAVFAVLAIGFSSSWLHLYDNAVLAGSVVWVPWCLWALESWLKHPNARSAALMGAAFGGLLQGGYPQTFHGTIVYMIVRLIPTLLTRTDRHEWRLVLRARLSTGLLAVIICAALAAIQLLPLLELTSLSHRRAGTALVFQVGWVFYARGLLFSWYEGGQHYAAASIGSLFVCITASLTVIFNRATPLLGHLAAGIALIMLGGGQSSPIFALIYDHDLLPGLHFFRTDIDYLWVGTVGIGVAAAAAVDGMARWRPHDWDPLLRSPQFWGLTVLVVLWIGIALRYKAPDLHDLQFVLPVAAGGGVLLLGAIRSLRFAGVLMAGLLLVECLALRLHPVRQIEVSALAEPSSARAIKAQPDWQDYRMTDLSSGMGDMLADPWAADAVPNFLRMKTAMSGMTPAIWGLRSMKGALALPLARWKLADAVLDEEIAGTGGLSPGLRLIDVLAVRYVSADATIARPAFREFWHEPGMSWITENTAALPRFQIYDRQVFVDTPEAALDYIENWKERVLVVEDPSRSAEQPETAIGPPESTAEPATFSVQHASETAYRLSVTASRPCWLFLADANYPGWGATVDGVETKVLSAQLLGKAVRIPAGQHEVRMEFHSSSVARGALISAVALIVTAYLIIFGWRRPWPRPSRLAAAAGADES